MCGKTKIILKKYTRAKADSLATLNNSLMKNFLKLMIGEDFTKDDVIPFLCYFGGLMLLLTIVSIIEKL